LWIHPVQCWNKNRNDLFKNQKTGTKIETNC